MSRVGIAVAKLGQKGNLCRRNEAQRVFAKKW